MLNLPADIKMTDNPLDHASGVTVNETDDSVSTVNAVLTTDGSSIIMSDGNVKAIASIDSIIQPI